ncbi:hypothetical protein SASPL_111514 [Salvia splendens]|uniref:Coiled-coil domain-containing protein 47 n=1 Tax=Salvia splendens TaxID=180675 RepID=A0A8X9A3E9_SALSN|nr:uncharacterized protein At5g49945-like [Salvia splendens]KAG6427272.1 hypothetical protein SASPL_111514 [Salvia splendens]
MAIRSSSSLLRLKSPLSLLLPRGDAFLYLFALLSIFSLLLHHLTPAAAQPHFEGFDADEDDDFALGEPKSEEFIRSSPPPITLSTSTPESHHGPPDTDPSQIQSPPSDQNPKPASFDYWDEDEFEGIPPTEPITETTAAAAAAASESDPVPSSEDSVNDLNSDAKVPWKITSFTVEIACVSFLIVFAINYFTGKKENENLALAWASKFATKDSIFDKNFSLLGVGETDDSPLLLQEGKSVFKFYASGRRYCSGLLATMELKSRHDLISRLYNMVVPCKDEITFEVYMNDDSMDQVVFAMARKKMAKTMQKELRDLQRFAGLVNPPNGRKWVADELQVVSESKEVATDLITDAVLDQVFGDKAFEKFGKGFISMHLSDQQPGSSKKMLIFKFALPDKNNMADMTRLVALVPYYIDLIGRYKLSSHARSKTEAARAKVAQELYKELQYARQDALQKKKAEQRKKLEEAEAKLSAEALRKKEAKDRSRQMKKAMPKMKMTKAH